MTSLLGILFLVSFCAFIVGLIKPSCVKQNSRKRAGFIFGAATVFFFVFIAVLPPEVVVPETQSVVAATSTPAARAEAPVNTVQEPVSQPATVAPSAPKVVVPAESSVVASGDKAGPYNLYPDPTLTPGGVLTTDVSQICTSGYTATVRNVSVSTKKQVYAEYGVSYPQPTGANEVDHFIPLEIGGSNDIKNLWLEPASPTPGFHQKDQFENYEHAQICSGALTVQEAQRRMVTDWYKYWLIETGSASTSAAPVSKEPTTTQTSATAPANTSDPLVKKSSSGICHQQGTTYYDKTTNFTPYDTVDACLASGGRLPKQ